MAALIQSQPQRRRTRAGSASSFSEEGLDLGDLVVEGGVDAAFDVAADLLEEALGRVQLRAVGRQADERQVEVGDVVVAVAGGVVPDERHRGGPSSWMPAMVGQSASAFIEAPSSTRPARPARRPPRTGSATRT